MVRKRKSFTEQAMGFASPSNNLVGDASSLSCDPIRLVHVDIGAVNIAHDATSDDMVFSSDSSNNQHESILPENTFDDVNDLMLNLVDVRVEYDVDFDLADPDTNIQGVGQDPSPSRKPPTSPLLKVSLEPDILPTVPPCLHCEARRFKNETKGFCCSDNGVKLVLYDSPSELYDLFTSRSDESVHFRTYVRTYNNTLAFTSFGVSCDLNLCRRNRGVYTFKAQGQIYHSIKSLFPSGVRPSNLQLYFYDTEHEIQNRLALSDRLQEGTLKDIFRLLANNHYSKFFRNLGSIPDLSERSIIIRSNAPLDQRVY